MGNTMSSLKLDNWQKEILETKGNLCLRSGRQVGKSTIIAIKTSEFAIKNAKKTVLVIASVERQAYLLFDKILAYMGNNYSRFIKMGRDRPTKHKLSLKNGSVIYCLPTGLTGQGIRGFTIDMLIADEAAFIPELVWTAVTPMLAATKGVIILLSTPHGKEGYYYECFKDEKFKNFHVSSEDCERIDKDYLERERKRMSIVEYGQEYLGEFIDELRQFFPTDLIEENMVLDKERDIKGVYYLGVDFAGYGGDENAFVIVKKINKESLDIVEIQTTSSEQIKNNITGDTIDRIKIFNKKYDFRKIYVDDGGLGSPIFDFLLKEDNIKRKLVGLNNAKRSIEYSTDRRKRIFKEDMYGNLLRLMEQHKISLLKDPNLNLSLKSIQYEYTEDKNIKIFGKYSHITEALMRAAWCIMDKSLNIWVRF